MSAKQKIRNQAKQAVLHKRARKKALLFAGILLLAVASFYAYSQFFIFGQPAQLEAMELRTQVEEHVLTVEGTLNTDTLVFAKAELKQEEGQVSIQVNTALPSSVCRDRKRTFQCSIPLDGVQQVYIDASEQKLLWSADGGSEP